MNCEVILDLLPLYADGLTSEESADLIKQHIETCHECRAAAEQMCAPMESEPITEPDIVTAVKKQKRRSRRKTVIACICTALLLLLGYWIYMETHFTFSTPVAVSTDASEILSEMPELLLTDREIAFSDAVFEIPIVAEFGDNDTLTPIPLEQAEEYLADILPDGATVSEVSAGHHWFSLDYTAGEIRVILLFIDGDDTGNTDIITKTVSIVSEGEEVSTVYEARYDAAFDTVSYSKYALKHIWFGFLKME